MNEIGDLRRKRSLKHQQLTKGFNLTIKKSIKRQEQQPTHEQQDQEDEDDDHDSKKDNINLFQNRQINTINNNNFIHSKTINSLMNNNNNQQQHDYLEDIENDILNLQQNFIKRDDNDINKINNNNNEDDNLPFDKLNTCEKSPTVKWQDEQSNNQTVSPYGLFTNDNQNITSGDGFFRDDIHSNEKEKQQNQTLPIKRIAFNLNNKNKDDDGHEELSLKKQSEINEGNDEINSNLDGQNNDNNVQESSQMYQNSENMQRSPDSPLRKRRASKVAMADRFRDRQRSSKVITNKMEFSLQLIKKIKSKKAYVKQGTYSDNKNSSPGFSFMSHIKKINILKRFQNKMKDTITKSDLDSLTKFQLELVNDTSHIVQIQNSSFTYKMFKDKLKWLFSVMTRKDSYSPDSSFFIIWKGILIITYLLTIFDVPLQFLHNYSEISSLSNLVVFFYIPIFVFIVEIILNFNTGFYREGQIVEDQQQIIENYIEFQFWLDTVTVCGFGISQILPYAKVLFLIRIYNLFLQIRQFEDRAQFTQTFPSFWTLLKLFTLIFCVAHFCGCGFSMIAYLESSNNINSFTWHKRYNISDEDWKTHYIYSLYFSFITMITVGYGDIVPQTNLERIYVILMTLISAAVFGYSVNTIGVIFQDIAAKSVNYRMLKRDIGYYMRSREIDSQLQVKVYQYLSYYHLETQQEHQQTDDILSKLSHELKLEIKKNYFGKALSTSYFLTSNFSTQFISELTFQVKEVFYRKGDNVFTRNDIDQRLLIITKGQCELSFSHPTLSEVSLLKIDKGDVGSKGFMTGLPREVTLRTLSHCTFAYITLYDFLQTIKSFPVDYEKFCMIKDSIVFYENESQKNLHCFSCNKFGHGVMNCPFIHLKKSKEIIIQKHLFCPQQGRETHKRNRIKMQNMIDIDIIKQDLKTFRVDVIQKTKKDAEDDDYYEELILKQDKDFFLEVECIQYDQETQTYSIDPKEKYLYPDDDFDEEDDDMDENDDEYDSDSDEESAYIGSIVIDKQFQAVIISDNQEPLIQSPLKKTSTLNKRQEYQKSKNRASNNVVSLTYLGQTDFSNGQMSPSAQPLKDLSFKTSLSNPNNNNNHRHHIHNHAHKNHKKIPTETELRCGSQQQIENSKQFQQQIIQIPTIKFQISSDPYKKSSLTQIHRKSEKLASFQKGGKQIFGVGGGGQIQQQLLLRENSPKNYGFLKSKTAIGTTHSQNKNNLNPMMSLKHNHGKNNSKHKISVPNPNNLNTSPNNPNTSNHSNGFCNNNNNLNPNNNNNNNLNINLLNTDTYNSIHTPMSNNNNKASYTNLPYLGNNNNNSNNNPALILNKGYKNTLENAPMLKIQDVPSSPSQSIQQQQQYNNMQQSINQQHRKSIMLVHPNAITNGLFSPDQQPQVMQSLTLSQNDKIHNQLYDMRKSGYLNGCQLEQLLFGYASTDIKNLHNLMYSIDFDIAKEYQIYFPNGNYTAIIKSIKSKQRFKNISTLKQSKTTFKTKVMQTMSNLS